MEKNHWNDIQKQFSQIPQQRLLSIGISNEN